MCIRDRVVPEQTRQLPFVSESKTIEFIKIGAEKLQIVVDEIVLIYSDFRTEKSHSS